MQSERERGEARSVFMASIKGLALVGGLVAAFLFSPALYHASAPLVEEFARHNYGADWASVSVWLWWVPVALGVFFGTSAVLSMALMASGLAVASLFR